MPVDSAGVVGEGGDGEVAAIHEVGEDVLVSEGAG
jgi:hypothetical protein